MRTPLPHPPQDERGFILVGVVTFMLALTILGMSLFALSSYEAQFFTASAAREQSLQNSESGMEVVKALIGATGARLEDAHRAEGQLGVTHAFAYQWRGAWSTNDTTSTGPVNWDSTLVIVVAAKVGGVERTLESRFVPGGVDNPYQRLLSAGQGIVIDGENSTDPSRLQLSGRVWHPVKTDADTAWTNDVDWDSGRPIQRGTPPFPDAKSLVDANLGLAPEPAFNSTSSPYTLTFPGGTGKFFSSPSGLNRPTANHEDEAPEFNAYTFYTGADLIINVSGTAVWLVPAGVCFKDQVTVRVSSGSTATLVIVAEPSGRDAADPNRGICFKGGLAADANVRLFLVSNGDISVIHHNDDDLDHAVANLSIVAGGHIELGGTDNTDKPFRLSYDAASMDAIADQLLAKNRLPSVSGGSSSTFVAARGFWLETTPR